MSLMLGEFFSRLFSSKQKEPPPPLPMFAENELVDCLRDARLELGGAARRDVLEAMRHHRKIEAIKALRENVTPRIGLKESKDFIEEFESRLRRARDRFGR